MTAIDSASNVDFSEHVISILIAIVVPDLEFGLDSS